MDMEATKRENERPSRILLEADISRSTQSCFSSHMAQTLVQVPIQPRLNHLYKFSLKLSPRTGDRFLLLMLLPFSFLWLLLKQADLIAGRPELAAVPCILVKGQRVHNAGAVEHQGL